MLHTHSTASDGWISPDRVLKAYHNSGYGFVCLTDHWKVTPRPKAAENDILYIPGVELDGGKTDVGDYHFIGIDVNQDALFFRDRRKKWTARKLVDLISSQGGLVALAHPYWNGVTWVDIQDVVNDLFALEVWNTGCEVEIGRGLAEVQWDDVLSRGHRLCGIAVDDAHNYYKDSMQAWVMVRVTSLTKKSIRTALKKGAFYSSTGPTIYEVSCIKNNITIKTSPVRRIVLISSPGKGATITAREGTYLTQHTFRLPSEDASYVRIRVTDSSGHSAWTNPLFI